MQNDTIFNLAGYNNLFYCVKANTRWLNLFIVKHALVSSSLQFLIVVVDSTDRERLAVTKAELYNMLNHEVRHFCLLCIVFLKLCHYSC